MTADDVVAEVRARYFPMTLETGGLWAGPSTGEEEFAAAIKPVYRLVFPQDPPFAIPPQRLAVAAPLRRLHSNVHHERILIRDGAGAVAGWLSGEMEDRSTFYIRSLGFVAEHRNRGAARFYRPFLDYLRDLGYERVTSHHLPDNNPVIIMQLKLGFVIDGMTLDERWGPMVKLVLHLHDDRRREYQRRFRLS